MFKEHNTAQRISLKICRAKQQYKSKMKKRNGTTSVCPFKMCFDLKDVDLKKRGLLFHSSIIEIQCASYCTVQRNDEIRAKNSNLPGSPFAQHCKHLISETVLAKAPHL